ncbi:MAG: hypothetical protein ACI9E5_001322 [Candidatus Omnitrophota bacterium]|jgi:hypothetical protein
MNRVNVGDTNVKSGLVSSTCRILGRSHLSTKSFMRNKKKKLMGLLM